MLLCAGKPVFHYLILSVQKINLNGEWSFKLDPDNRGYAEDWFAPSYRLIDSEKSILVPACWENFEQDYEGVAWYAKEVQIDPSYEGRGMSTYIRSI